MKHYLRDTCVWAFATGVGVGALIVAGIVAANADEPQTLPRCPAIVEYVVHSD